MTDYKSCTKCKIVKPFSEFGPAPRKTDTLGTVCKVCVKKRQQRWSAMIIARNKGKPSSDQFQICRLCLKEKSGDKFGRKSNTKAGFDTACLECCQKRDRLRYQNNTEKRRNQAKWGALKFSFGISKERWFELLSEQDGKCAICNKEFEFTKRSKMTPCVDHDHLTKRVRGLLCRLCNQGIGLLCDSLDLVRSAAHYLEKHGK